jgi:sortase A
VSDVFKEGVVRKLIKALPLIFFLCGLCFAGACFVGYRQLLSSDDNAKQMTHQIQSKEKSQQQLNEKRKQANFDPNQIKPVTPSEYAAAQLKFEDIVNHYGIGSVFIPSSNIRSKILAGMSNQNLMVAVGTYYPDQELGKGNYVLLAHNLVEGGGALGSLPNTKLDHVIYATDFTNVYEYKAIKNETVNQANGQLLEKPSDNKPAIITLFRCEGGLNTVNRALVQGEFVRSYPADEASNDVKVGLGLGVMTKNSKYEGATGTSDTATKHTKGSFG